MRENGVVTIFRPDGTSGRLISLGTVPAWVSRKDMLRNEGAGIYNDDRFDVRIEIRYLDNVRSGDLIFFGRAETNCVSPTECRRIESVTENKVGTAPHWHIAAEYRYSR